MLAFTICPKFSEILVNKHWKLFKSPIPLLCQQLFWSPSCWSHQLGSLQKHTSFKGRDIRIKCLLWGGSWKGSAHFKLLYLSENSSGTEIKRPWAPTWRSAWSSPGICGACQVKHGGRVQGLIFSKSTAYLWYEVDPLQSPLLPLDCPW